MNLRPGCESVLLTALFCLVAHGDTTKTFFSMELISPDTSDVNSVSFSRDAFERFYNCLLASGTCTISYAQSYSTKHTNNVEHITGSHEPNHLWANRETPARSSWCRNTRPDQLTCENKAHDKNNYEHGLRPLWPCANLVCSCVYFSNAKQIHFDNINFQECSRKNPPSPSFTRLRTRRASRSSSKSSSSRSRSSSRSSWSSSRSSWSSSNSGSRTYTSSTSSGSGSGDSNAGMIVGITIGAIVFAFIVIGLVLYCISKHKSQNNLKPTEITPESYNEIEMAEAAAVANGQNESQFAFSEKNLDTEISKENIDTFPTLPMANGNHHEYFKHTNYEDMRETNTVRGSEACLVNPGV